MSFPIDAQTANTGSVNKYTIQQHVKWWDNCIEAPNTHHLQHGTQPLSRRGTERGCPDFLRASPLRGPSVQRFGFIR